MQGRDSKNIRTIVLPYGELTKERPEWEKDSECWNKDQGKRWQWPGTGGGKRDGWTEVWSGSELTHLVTLPHDVLM